ncbi:uncharacterized protein LOC134677784 [Cydia fagiglandana]|uniref:uncharacterized protein LOC134677784 n=1 Tax=Cydia fagiglandana TaxID=1458189 RepID=UPI002FEE29DC
MSPKRSPAPAPPSPAGPPSAFSFPAPAATPAPPGPATPTHEPLSGGGSASSAGVCGTPPPLPPRRPREPAAAPLPTPLLQWNSGPHGAGCRHSSSSWRQTISYEPHPERVCHSFAPR